MPHSGDLLPGRANYQYRVIINYFYRDCYLCNTTYVSNRNPYKYLLNISHSVTGQLQLYQYHL